MLADDGRPRILDFGIARNDVSLTLSGQRAFSGENVFSTMHQTIHEEPPSLSGLVPDLDRRIVGIVERAIAKDPERRYHSMAAMRHQHRGDGEQTGS